MFRKLFASFILSSVFSAFCIFSSEVPGCGGEFPEPPAFVSASVVEGPDSFLAGEDLPGEDSAASPELAVTAQDAGDMADDADEAAGSACDMAEGADDAVGLRPDEGAGAAPADAADDGAPAQRGDVSPDSPEGPEADDAGLYPEITSQDEWYLGRLTETYRFDGVRPSHEKAVSAVFDSYMRKSFDYELLHDLQRDLYNSGHFESIDPEVEITASKGLCFVFHFREIPVVASVSFAPAEGHGELSASYATLVGKLGFKVGDAKTEGEIGRAASEILKYYRKNGRPGTEVSVDIRRNDADNTHDVTFVISEDAEKRVGEIVFEGCESFKPSQLQKRISTKTAGGSRKGYFESEKLAADVESLRKFYMKNGFRDVTIGSPGIEDITAETDSCTKLRIVFPIDEGVRWNVGEVSFSRNTVFDGPKLMKEISLGEGDIFDDEKLAADEDSLLMLYYNRGYIYATVEAVESRHEDTGKIDIEYRFAEGYRAYVENITFSGLAKTKEYVFRREMALREGDIFSRDALQKSYQNIYNTGLIKDLNYKLTRGSDNQHLNLDFEIQEAQQMDVTFGITFGGNEGGFPLSFIASLNNKNLRGTGMTMSVGTQITTDYQSVNFAFGSGWFKNRRWSNSFSFSFERSVKKNVMQKNPDSTYQSGHNNAFPFGYSSHDEFEAFDENTPALRYLMRYEMFRFALGWNTGYTWMFDAGRLSLSGGASFGLNHVIYDENDYIPFEYLIYQYRQGWKFSNRLSVSLVWDGRDFVDDTTKGYMLSQNFVYAGGFVGGLSNYMKSQTTASGYITLFRTGSRNETKPRAFVASYTVSVSFMLPQFWNCGTDSGNEGWALHDAKYGATRSEMLYIDGMRVARGHSSVYDIEFMWDNMLEFSYPIVKGIVNAEIFASMTCVSKQLDNISGSLVWYGAFGAGVKLKISGFPLGFYFTGDYRIKSDEFKWIDGGLFDYVHPVLAISTSLI